MSMDGQDEVGVGGVLADRWRRWTEIVRLFALRKTGRYDLDPDQYHQLHNELVETCHRQAARGDGGGQKFFEELGETIAPWVTLDSLGWADREIVYQLLERAERTQRLLDGRPAVRLSRKWLVCGILCAAVLVMGAAAAWAVRSGALLAVQRWSGKVAGAMHQWALDQPLLVGGTIVTLVVIVLIWRSVGRY